MHEHVWYCKNLKEVIQKSMKQWKTELMAGNQDLDEMCIKRGIS